MTKLRLSFPRFFFFIAVVCLLFLFGSIIFVIFRFEGIVGDVLRNDLAAHVSSGVSIFERNFDRYFLVSKYLSSNADLAKVVDGQGIDAGVNKNFIEAKVAFDLEETFLLSQDGEVLFKSARDESLLLDKEFRKTSKAVEDTGISRGFFFDSPYFKNKVFYMVSLVQGEKGRGILVLGNIFDQEYLKALFALPQRGVFLFSNKGEILSSNIDPAIFSAIATPASAGDETKRVAEEVVQEFNSAEFAGIVRFAEVRYNTFPVGSIGFYVDTKELLGITRSFSQGNSIIFTVLPVVTLLFVFTMVRKLITLPIVNLKKGFEGVSSGDFGVRMEPEGLSEIQDINDSFNDTVVKLRESYEHLEDKVKEKTKELQSKVEEMEKMNKFMVGREMKMAELKAEIAELKKGSDTPKA